MTTTIYVSGAIASDPNFHEKFAKASERLEAAGYKALNPVTVTACEDSSCLPPGGNRTNLGSNEHTWECYMKHDIAALVHCDGVAMLPDWLDSRGASVERQIAHHIGLKVADLEYWIDNGNTVF